MLEAEMKINREISQGIGFGRKAYDRFEYEVSRMGAAVRGVVRDLTGEDPYGRTGLYFAYKNVLAIYGERRPRSESGNRRYVTVRR